MLARLTGWRAWMERRDFVRWGVAAGGAAAATGVAAAVPKPSAEAILDAGVLEQQASMAAGKLTSHALVTQYLARIARIDKAGPRINAVIELNPDAEKIA